MAIIFAVLGVSGTSIDTLVLHIAVRNAYTPLAPHPRTLLAGNLPDVGLPMQHRSLSCQVPKKHYMDISLIVILNRVVYFYFASATCIILD